MLTRMEIVRRILIVIRIRIIGIVRGVGSAESRRVTVFKTAVAICFEVTDSHFDRWML